MRETIARHLDGIAVGLLLVLLIVAGWRAWLSAHPWHDPSAPFDLRQREGWATGTKLAALRDDIPACRAVLTRSAIDFVARDPAGEGACRREDRLRPETRTRFAPETPEATCAVHAGFDWWWRHRVVPAAREILEAQVVGIAHLGTYSCRRIGGGSSGRWSEHATGNAIDIAAFTLADGSRISVLADWEGDDPQARFLRAVRDGACDAFGTVLSPDYNAAHADHLHLDQARRGLGSYCR